MPRRFLKKPVLKVLLCWCLRKYKCMKHDFTVSGWTEVNFSKIKESIFIDFLMRKFENIRLIWNYRCFDYQLLG